MDYSPPGSSVNGISQARIRDWVDIFFFRESFWPRDRIPVSSIAGRRFTIWATSDDTPKNVKKGQVAVISGIEFSHGLMGGKNI